VNDGEARRTLSAPLLDENPIALRMLGVCSALAVTKTVATALVMSLALTVVVTASNVVIALLRRHIGHSIRLIVQITVIASLVIVVDQCLQAWAWEMSRRLSVFVGLIVTNCIVLGRAEGYAMQHGPGLAALDGLGNGLGYTLVLVLVGAVRELLGSGSLLGVTLLRPVTEGGWFEPIQLMLLPPSAFFLIAGLVWALRTWKPEQVEAADRQGRAG
jgi:Na+-transporting NADH:ubiquinone oxidoreductase subunit D